MKLVRTVSMIIALAGATTVYADTPQKAPEAKKAPEKAPPAKDAPKTEEISQADADKVLAFFKQFSDAIVANKDSCPNMAKAINGVIDKNKAFLEYANKMKTENKKMPKALEDKMGEQMKVFLPHVMKCRDDKDVAAAMQRMDRGGADAKGPPPADAGKAAPPADAKTAPKKDAPPAKK